MLWYHVNQGGLSFKVCRIKDRGFGNPISLNVRMFEERKRMFEEKEGLRNNYFSLYFL